MHLSVAFSMHSQAFAAASRALEEKPPVLMDTPRSPIYGHSPKVGRWIVTLTGLGPASAKLMLGLCF